MMKWMILIAMCIGCMSLDARAADIRLHEEVGVQNETVYLRDIAELAGDEAAALGDLVVATLDEKTDEATVTLQSVRALLEARGNVNWAKVTLRGYATCTVYRLRSPDEAQRQAAAPEPAPVIANPSEPVTLQSALTVRQRAVAALQQYAGGDAATLRISFDERDETVLSTEAWRDRWEIEPATSATLGRVPLIVRRYNAADEVIETHRVTAQVLRRSLAVVTTRTISKGRLFTPDDLHVREVYLSSDRVQPVTDTAQVIGQTCGRTLRADAIVESADVQPPVLVKRGDKVTVRSISGPLVVRMVGRATEDGGRDDLIRVRNDMSRDEFMARVTGVGQVVAVNMQPTASEGDER